MKKIQAIVKPMLMIIFGALLLLFYLNYLQLTGAGLAIGIIAVIFSAYYLAFGIIDVILGDKINKNLRVVFDILNISLFALLMFVIFLLRVINAADIMGPTAWVIHILGLIASILVVAFYIVARVAKNAVLTRFGFLFAAIFALALLLDVLFEIDGSTTVLGNISLIQVAIYILYVNVLFVSMPKEEAKEEQSKEDAEA